MCWGWHSSHHSKTMQAGVNGNHSGLAPTWSGTPTSLGSWEKQLCIGPFWQSTPPDTPPLIDSEPPVWSGARGHITMATPPKRPMHDTSTVLPSLKSHVDPPLKKTVSRPSAKRYHSIQSKRSVAPVSTSVVQREHKLCHLTVRPSWP